MNKGVLLWKTGKLNEAVEWMREARKHCRTICASSSIRRRS
jgi:hypothetical protein